jgi:hypothetical protein
MPSRNRPKPAPVAIRWGEGSEGAIVTKTHDVDEALDALLDLLRVDALNDEEALEWLEDYLAVTPVLETGRWVWYGSMTAEGEGRVWKTAPLDQRGVTRAVVWYL